MVEKTAAKILTVDVQFALDEKSSISVPDSNLIKQWASAAIDEAGKEKYQGAQLTVRIVDEEEISQLNDCYRNKAGTTNVLSFPFILPPGMPENETLNSLGDVVVCAAVVNKEAGEQQKNQIAHWAHMIVHGTLHLMGFDHQNKQAADEMESLEKIILFNLGFSDPYKEV